MCCNSTTLGECGSQNSRLVAVESGHNVMVHVVVRFDIMVLYLVSLVLSLSTVYSPCCSLSPSLSVFSPLCFPPRYRTLPPPSSLSSPAPCPLISVSLYLRLCFPFTLPPFVASVYISFCQSLMMSFQNSFFPHSPHGMWFLDCECFFCLSWTVIFDLFFAFVFATLSCCCVATLVFWSWIYFHVMLCGFWCIQLCLIIACLFHPLNLASCPVSNCIWVHLLFPSFLWSLYIQTGPPWACQLPEWGKQGIPACRGKNPISLLGVTINSKILENNYRGTRNKSCRLSFIQHLFPQFALAESTCTCLDLKQNDWNQIKMYTCN